MEGQRGERCDVPGGDNPGPAHDYAVLTDEPPPPDDAPPGDSSDGEWGWPPSSGDLFDPAGFDAELARVAAELDADPVLVVPDGSGPARQYMQEPRSGEWTATVAGMPPGPDLAHALAESAAPGTLAETSSFELGELAAACQRIMSWARSVQASVITELTRRPEMQPLPSGAGMRSISAGASTAVELTDLLPLTANQAEAVVAESVQLVEDLPRTHAALADGRLLDRQVRVIADELRHYDRDVVDQVEQTVLGQADTPTLHTTRLRRRVRRALHDIAPDETEKRRSRSVEERYVKVTPADDGMAWLEAFLPAEAAMAIKATLDAAAETLKRCDAAAGDPKLRTVDQRRADALAHLAWASLTASRLGGTTCPACGTENPAASDSGFGAPVTLGSVHGRPVTVNVTIPFTTLIGMDNQPGELAGYGPIPAHVARHLSSAGVWRWVGVHPVSGAVLDHGRTRYVPTRDLIDHVILRDQTCRAPGCTVIASRCDLDHTVPYPHGPTAPGNLAALCANHHRLKHHTRWQMDQPTPGTHIWTSPTGRTIASPAADSG